MEFLEHKRLIDLLPEFLRKYREYRAIVATEQIELDNVQVQISGILSDAFTDTATESGIARKEKMYGITPREGATLEERRLAVKAKETCSLPHTIRQYKRMLSLICGDVGFEVVLDHGRYALEVKIDGEQAGSSRLALIFAIQRLNRQMLPANLTYGHRVQERSVSQTSTGAAVSQKRFYNVETTPAHRRYDVECDIYSAAGFSRRKQETIEEV